MTVISPFGGDRRFFKGNLHTHSTLSDAVRDPGDVCALYREAGYDFLALTDHFLSRYGFPIADTREFRTNSFTTLLGAEVHAPRTELGEMWHILSVGLPLDFAPTPSDESGAQLAERCSAAGAYVAIAHPGWYGLTVADAESLPTADAVEVYNHTSQVRTDRGDGWALLDTLLARGRRLNACATDDAHFKCNDYFGGWVMVQAEALAPEAILAALKQGRYYSSQGPEIHALEVRGGELALDCSPAASVMILGRGSASNVVFGDTLTSARFDLAALRGSPFVRAVVTDAGGRRAWSNPIWLDG